MPGERQRPRDQHLRAVDLLLCNADRDQSAVDRHRGEFDREVPVRPLTGGKVRLGVERQGLEEHSVTDRGLKLPAVLRTCGMAILRA